MDAELVMDLELFRAVITKIYKDALEGCLTHIQYILQLAGVEPREIAQSADHVSVAVESLEWLLEYGVLNPILRKPRAVEPWMGRMLEGASPASGLGAWQVALAIGISAAVVVAVIAAALVVDEENGRLAAQREAICAEAMRNPDDEYHRRVLDACVELNKAAQENMQPPGIEGINKALMIAAVGLVIYGAVLMAPHFTRALGKAKVESQRTKEAA